MSSRRDKQAPPTPADEAPIWGGGDKPTWLAPEQPRKRDWSPARDRLEAEMELRARLDEERKRKRGSGLAAVVKAPIFLIEALIEVARGEDEEYEDPTALAIPPSMPTILDNPPNWLVLPGMPTAPPRPAPPPEEEAKVKAAAPAVEEAAPPAPVEPETPPPPVAWPDVPTPAPEAPPKIDWHIPTQVPTEAPPAEVEPPPPAPAPPAEPVAAPLPAETPRLVAETPEELVRMLLDTAVRVTGADLGFLVLNDGPSIHHASNAFFEKVPFASLGTLADTCRHVLESGHPHVSYDANAAGELPLAPHAVLVVPIHDGSALVGAVLLTSYRRESRFSAEQADLVRLLAEQAAGGVAALLAPPAAAPEPEVVAPPAPAPEPEPEAAAPPAPAPEVVTPPSEPEAEPPPEAKPEPEPKPEAAARPAPKPPAIEPTVVMPRPAQVAAVPAPAPAKAPPLPKTKRIGWADRVRSKLAEVQQRREMEQERFRDDVLNALRNLSWEGYTALIADVFRRKKFEIFPPPDGPDTDVIDMVADRDGQRYLVNCQIRGVAEVPAAAVGEFARVVSNYIVAGAYLISDGSYQPDAVSAAPRANVILVDREALVDLVVETTLKDERRKGLANKVSGVLKI